MKFLSNRNNTSGGGVPVSANLQKAVIVATAAASLLQLVVTVWAYATNAPGFSVSFAVVAMGPLLLPIVAFGVAYALSPVYPLRLNRWFIAILKAVILAALLGLLESLKNYAAVILYSGGDQAYSAPPDWITSATGDYIIMAVCLALFVVVAYKGRQVK